MTDIQNAKSASTDTFVTALVFNAIVFAAEVVAFTVLRPYFPAVYQPRTYIVPKDRRASDLTSSILGWPLAVLRADYSDIKRGNGLDAYFFVRFLRMVVIILLPIWLLSWAVLLPLTSVNTSVSGHTGLDRFIMGNISADDQPRYWAHLGLAWVFTFWVFYNIRKEMHHFVYVRQQWLVDPINAQSAQASSVLITGIPQRYLTESALTKMYSHLPGGVRKVWLNRDLKDMPEIYERRTKATSKLEAAENNLLKIAAKIRDTEVQKEAKAAKKVGRDVSPNADGKPLTAPSSHDTEPGEVSLADKLVPKDQRPTHRLPLSFLPFALPLVGKKVDTIEWAREEIETTTKELKDRQRVFAQDIAATSSLPFQDGSHADSLTAGSSSQTHPPLNSAFVLFNRQISAHLAAQALTHHQPYRMSDRYLNVAPEDVIWANLNMNPYEIRVRTAISWAITLAMIIFWAVPVAFVGAVSNIHSLCSTYRWLNWICDLPPVVVGILTGILPPVMLVVLMMLVPIFLRLLARFEGMPKKTMLELSLMTRFFMFQIIHSFLIVSLSSGIIAALPQLLDDPGSIPSLLAENLPKASNFFLTYVILEGLSGTAAGLLTIVPLILYYVKLVILGSTPRSIYNIKYSGRSVSWGTLFPATTLLFVITLAYSVIAPIINGLACVTFFLFFILWKYLFLWQLEQPRSGDTGGLFFPKAIHHVFVGLYLGQILLAALFFLAQNQNKRPSSIPQGALMVFLIGVTLFFHLIIANSYGPLIRALPLSLADRTYSMENIHEGTAEPSGDQASVVSDNGLDKKQKFPEPQLQPGHASSQPKAISPVRQPTPPPAASPSFPSPDFAQPSSFSTSNHSHDDVNSDMRRPDEDPNEPKAFYHPACIEPQQTVWIPKDTLGLGETEAAKCRSQGVLASTEGAAMDAKGHVTIHDSPPDSGLAF